MSESHNISKGLDYSCSALPVATVANAFQYITSKLNFTGQIMLMEKNRYVKLGPLCCQASTRGPGMCPLMIKMNNCDPKTEAVGDSGSVVHCLNDHLLRKGFCPKCWGEKCPTQHCQVAGKYFMPA